MGRFVFVVAAITAFGMMGLLAGCSSSSPVTTTAQGPVPAVVSLSPAQVSDLEVGKTISFTGSASDTGGTALSDTITYQSSNTAVLTVTTGGLACAGSWDSLTTPTVC